MLVGSWRPIFRLTRGERRRVEKRRRAFLGFRHLKTRLRLNVKLIKKLIAHANQLREAVKKACSKARKICSVCDGMHNSIRRVIGRAYPELHHEYDRLRADPLNRPKFEIDGKTPFLWTVTKQVAILRYHAANAISDAVPMVTALKEYTEELDKAKVETYDWIACINPTSYKDGFPIPETRNVFVVFAEIREKTSEMERQMNQLKCGVKAVTHLFETYEGEDQVQGIAPSQRQKSGP